MSGNPSLPRVVRFKSVMRTLTEQRRKEEEIVALIAKKEVELNECRVSIAGLRNELDGIREEMDVRSVGNHGYEQRLFAFMQLLCLKESDE